MICEFERLLAGTALALAFLAPGAHDVNAQTVLRTLPPGPASVERPHRNIMPVPPAMRAPVPHTQTRHEEPRTQIESRTQVEPRNQIEPPAPAYVPPPAPAPVAAAPPPPAPALARSHRLKAVSTSRARSTAYWRRATARSLTGCARSSRASSSSAPCLGRPSATPPRRSTSRATTRRSGSRTACSPRAPRA